MLIVGINIETTILKFRILIILYTFWVQMRELINNKLLYKGYVKIVKY